MYASMILGIYVVVQFYLWFKFSFLLFLGMVMYDNNMIMSLKQKKRKFEARIKLNHNIYIVQSSFKWSLQGTFVKFDTKMCAQSWIKYFYIYVGYTHGHLHNHVKGHKQQSSAIAKHYKKVHGMIPQDLLKCFEVLKKCGNKFDCLVYKMLFIRTLKPNLNVQSDSIHAKVFS